MAVGLGDGLGDVAVALGVLVERRAWECGTAPGVSASGTMIENAAMMPMPVQMVIQPLREMPRLGER